MHLGPWTKADRNGRAVGIGKPALSVDWNLVDTVLRYFEGRLAPHAACSRTWSALPQLPVS